MVRTIAMWHRVGALGPGRRHGYRSRMFVPTEPRSLRGGRSSGFAHSRACATTSIEVAISVRSDSCASRHPIERSPHAGAAF